MKIISNFFLIICLLIPRILNAQNYCFPESTRITYTGRGYLGQQLLDAAKSNTPDKLRFLLNQVAQQYRGNPSGFFQVMDTRDKDGFNIMLLAALTGDLENMDSILNTLEGYYGSNIQGIYEYLMTRDESGYNIVGLAEFIGNRYIMEQILIRAMYMLNYNKEMYYNFLNIGSYKEDWKPLSSAAYDNEVGNFEMMLKLGAYVLGFNSEYFNKFINASDVDGLNALSYTDNPQIKYALLNYGAKESDMKENPKLPMVIKYGLELNVASNHGNLPFFEKILNRAYEFKDDTGLLYYFFSARKGAGWNPFINTAADGQYKYLKLLLETMDKMFPEHEEGRKSELLGNADFYGRTPLHLAIARRHFEVARLIIDTIIRYSTDKPNLFASLSVPNELDGFTALITTVYAGEEFNKERYDFIKYFIEKMAELFGRDSRLFYLFINARDYNKWTALSYAYAPELIKLLKSYGAIDTPMKHYKGIGVFNRLALRGYFHQVESSKVFEL